ncbi:endospore germination permease [Salinibacillus aidingensis]|uniref:Endospore germination permease n=1 Tax=Salinibacillus aidingensis TaxID=237684 RepID=A0ABP3L2N5_9BACI
MIEKGKIDARQFTVLVVMYSLGTSIIAIPSTISTYAQENAWITIILTTLIGLMIVFLLNQVNRINKNKNLFELFEYVFGKWIGKSVTVLFLTFVYIVSGKNLRQIGDFITTQVMVETPIQVIMLIFVLTSLYAIKLGIEVIGRTSEIFFPYAFTSLMLLIIFVAPQADFKNIQPVLVNNIEGAFLTVFPTLGTPYFELVVFLALLPYVNRIGPGRKAFYIGVGIGSFLLFAVTLMSLLVLGPDFSARNVYPTYILGKKISGIQFLERIEILVAIAWFFTIFFKISINFYVLSLGMSHLFQLRSPKVLSTPLAFLILIAGVYLAPNMIAYQNFLAHDLAPLAGTFGIVLPVLLIIVARLRKKNKKKKKRKKRK